MNDQLPIVIQFCYHGMREISGYTTMRCPRALLDQLAWGLGYPNSLRGKFFRKLLKDSSYIPLPALINISAVERPHYAYCMYYAALLAERLNIKTISALEFGVAGGRGLLAMEKLAARISREVGISIEVYGFDTGEGLPGISSPYDLPYWFRPGYYKMDVDALRARLEMARLVLGDVRDTVDTFFTEFDPAPVGCIFHDLDYFSSTAASLKILDGDDKYFLPRCFFYFDDTVGGPWEMYGEENGELCAIRDFNEKNKDKKIIKNTNLTALGYYPWHHQIYYYHNFMHPLYGSYVGGAQQEKILSGLSLSSSHKHGNDLLGSGRPRHTPQGGSRVGRRRWRRTLPVSLSPHPPKGREPDQPQAG